MLVDSPFVFTLDEDKARVECGVYRFVSMTTVLSTCFIQLDIVAFFAGVCGLVVVKKKCDFLFVRHCCVLAR